MTGPTSLAARRRRACAPWLLALYVASGLAAPAAHLAHHRDDHTHGPAVRPSSAGGAFRALTAANAQRGHARQRDLASALASHGRMRWPWSAAHEAATAAELESASVVAHSHGPGTATHTHAQDEPSAGGAPEATPHRHDTPEAPERERQGPAGHGADSAAHFALAVIDAPPPVALPLPECTRRRDDPPPATTIVSSPRPLPPARGPPVLV